MEPGHAFHILTDRLEKFMNAGVITDYEVHYYKIYNGFEVYIRGLPAHKINLPGRLEREFKKYFNFKYDIKVKT